MVTALRRELGVPGAVVTGLGSILGTGVFVSIAVAAGFAGRWVLLAAPLAGVVAAFNGLSSAQLAAVHPVAGGTYEYGHRFLNAPFGYTAGWLFLVAKSASAATAATGASAYLVGLAGWSEEVRAPLAVGVVVMITAAVAGGIRRTAWLNALLVATTLVALTVFVVAASTTDPAAGDAVNVPPVRNLFYAVAFLFVGYTGYGRIATLGEEVRDPDHTIPRAVVATLVVTVVLYTAVAAAGWHAAGGDWSPDELGDTAAPLAALVSTPWSRVVEIGAIVAMLGVIVNLVLGLSRVWLAMGRRDDMPRALAAVGQRGSPTTAVILTGVTVAGIALIDDVRTTWSFSAFAVLLYYAITNAAALQIPDEDRRFPRWVSYAGLVSCLFLSFWVPLPVWLAGVAVIAAGWTWRIAWHRTTTRPSSTTVMATEASSRSRVTRHWSPAKDEKPTTTGGPGEGQTRPLPAADDEGGGRR